MNLLAWADFLLPTPEWKRLRVNWKTSVERLNSLNFLAIAPITRMPAALGFA
jgi:hypothetical protein